jgi:Leucine-rich repeat (LRR) protein/beta-lactamase regulating signal transducer with metallopeptidase domain
LFPFSIESIFSLVPFNAAPIPSDIALQATPRIDSGFIAIDNIISNALPVAEEVYSANPLQIWTSIGTYIWLAGIAVMLVYGVASYLVLKRRMQGATSINGIEHNIYEADEVKSPFVLGIVKPKIYLPTGLAGKEREYIILHELTHIRRRDHIIKFAAYFVLCLHWFNPLAWVAYILMSVDMELSCDERVLKETGIGIKKNYSLSLLMLSANRPKLRSSPLAFSEDGLKTRIKNVLKYKKYSRITIIVAVALAIALGVGLTLNGVGNNDTDIAEDNNAIAEPPRSEADSPAENGNTVINNNEENADSPLLSIPEEAPEFIEINGQQIDITETEVRLDSYSVTDADLEQLKKLADLELLQIIPGQYPPPDQPSNNGIINLGLISELDSVTYLQIMCENVGENIYDISPLAKMTNLRVLILGNNQIIDLSPLENLTNLATLSLDIPHVSNISPLARMPGLEELMLGYVQTDDFSVLSELKNLTFLYLYDTTISDLGFLTQLPNLDRLSLNNSQINDFSPLAELSNLSDLYIANSGLSDLSILSGLTNLTLLWLDDNSIRDISVLSELTNLEVLNLSFNPVYDISALAELTNLKSLFLHYSRVSDISALAGLTNLEILDLSLNQISDLSPLAGLSNLTSLSLMVNPIEDVSALTGLTNLEYVRLSPELGTRLAGELRIALPDAIIDNHDWGDS